MDELHDNTYHLWVPITDNELVKSIEVDENGDYVVQGVMTSDDNDEEGDSITPDGMDCSYFLTKGWIKYEHGNNPNQFIGEPLEVKVGQFTHPKLQKSVNGIFVKGRLFAHRELTKQAVTAISDLQKSNTKRTMGWSIEGNVKERDRKTGKILKSVLRNVVLTMNPVNTTTWAELAKSFAKNHEVEVNMLDKSMDTAGIQAVTPQSVEGATKDPQSEWVKQFRAFCRDNFLNKSLREAFITSDKVSTEVQAFEYASSKGLEYEEALTFASYIADRHDVIKSLFGQTFGGESSMENLANLLDVELEELRKSLLDDEEETEYEDEDGEEELNKSYGDDDEEDEEDDEEEEGDDDEEEDDEDEDVEKALRTDFAKSFGEQEENAQAFEVSDFLTNLVDEIGFHMDGFEKSVGSVRKQQNAVIGTLHQMGELIKSLTEEIQSVRGEYEELQKSIGDVMNRPVGRKSVVNQREAQTLTKSIASEGRALTRSQISDVLLKSFEAGEIPGSAVARFEAGVPLQNLELPQSVHQKLGL